MSVNIRTTILIQSALHAEALALAPQVSQPSLVMFPLVPASGQADAAATAYGARGRLHGWDATKEAENAATLAAAAPSFAGCFFWRGMEVDAQTMTFAQMLSEAGLKLQQKVLP